MKISGSSSHCEAEPRAGQRRAAKGKEGARTGPSAEETVPDALRDAGEMAGGRSDAGMAGGKGDDGSDDAGSGEPVAAAGFLVLRLGLWTEGEDGRAMSRRRGVRQAYAPGPRT